MSWVMLIVNDDNGLGNLPRVHTYGRNEYKELDYRHLSNGTDYLKLHLISSYLLYGMRIVNLHY